MRQSNLEGGANNQQMAEELLVHVNEATKHFVLTDESLRHKWAAGPDSDERRERQKNNFFHARSILRAMTEDRGRAAVRVTEAEQALDADQVENPENPSTTTLAEEFAKHSTHFDLRNGMIYRRIPGGQVGKATTWVNADQEKLHCNRKEGSCESG
jgi:hypothetical protein